MVCWCKCIRINPHFLFNTLNTIAAFTRTDPTRARDLLREFSVFYRRTLEGTEAPIPLSAELEQTRRYLNIDGYLPGRRIVIVGSGDIGLIMARRMTLEGAKVLCVCELMPYSGGLARNIVQCLDDYGIPLKLSHTVVEIHGKERLEGVTIARVDERRRPIDSTREYIPCDTLLLSVGLIPENELSKTADVALDRVTRGAVVDQDRQTATEGIFACGNVLHVHDLVDFVSEEAEIAGLAAANYVLNGANKPNYISVLNGKNITYVLPQKINKNTSENITLFFRVNNVYFKFIFIFFRNKPNKVIRSAKR